ncbi:hypothetical protein GCM10023323_22010 [Streptomyces thinghirensis]|uniref:Chitin-binding type-4 domain-containing protein n=1 Tax=Streptomyces thinghirensis TaxID=551547 RepID=A0ABP9T2F4_9ACTN
MPQPRAAVEKAWASSGHHVILTVWKASHMDQKYFLCSDVNFSRRRPDAGESPTAHRPRESLRTLAGLQAIACFRQLAAATPTPP